MSTVLSLELTPLCPFGALQVQEVERSLRVKAALQEERVRQQQEEVAARMSRQRRQRKAEAMEAHLTTPPPPQDKGEACPFPQPS